MMQRRRIIPPGSRMSQQNITPGRQPVNTVPESKSDDDFLSEIMSDDDGYSVEKPSNDVKKSSKKTVEAPLTDTKNTPGPETKKDDMRCKSDKKLDPYLHSNIRESKHSRARHTQRDIEVLELAALSGIVSYRTIQEYMGHKYSSSTYKLIQRLHNRELVQMSIPLGIKSLKGICLTKYGRKIVRENAGSGLDPDCIKVFKKSDFDSVLKTGYLHSKMGGSEHSLVIAHIIAVESRRLGVNPSIFYNERWMEKNCTSGEKDASMRVLKHRQAMMKAIRILTSDPNRDDILEQFPALWVPHANDTDPNKSERYKNYHQPDLILRMDNRDEGYVPRSIAYEIELSRKSHKEIQQVLRTWAWSGWLAYGEVRYITGYDSLTEHVRKNIAVVADEFDRLKEQQKPGSFERFCYREGAKFLRKRFTIVSIEDVAPGLNYKEDLQQFYHHRLKPYSSDSDLIDEEHYIRTPHHIFSRKYEESDSL
nr:MAG TPA: hypothetical protein [Caudoviricetes sp.]